MRPRFPLVVAVIGTTVCFVADLFAFDQSDYLRFTLLYLLIGLLTYAIVSLTWRPGLSVPREVFATLLGILPAVYVPHLVEACFVETSFTFADYWSYCIYGTAIATAVSLFFAYRRSELALAALHVRNAEARYDLLKVRMQPHFLFNALNGVSELISQDPKRAEAVTLQLSSLYRDILRLSDRRTTDLGTELGIVKSYLEIESIRLGPRLAYEVQSPIEAAWVPFPTLLAQTLVENAIKHGVSPSVEGGRITLLIEAVGAQRFRFLLRNTGAPLRSGIGNGISNTLDRLNLVYGDGHGFAIATRDGATEVSFYFTQSGHA